VKRARTKAFGRAARVINPAAALTSLKARGARHREPKPTRRGAFGNDVSSKDSNGS
jgi:hypothetical protein